MDRIVRDWQSAGLGTESHLRTYVLTMHRSELTIIVHLSERDRSEVKTWVRIAFAT